MGPGYSSYSNGEIVLRGARATSTGRGPCAFSMYGGPSRSRTYEFRCPLRWTHVVGRYPKYWPDYVCVPEQLSLVNTSTHHSRTRGYDLLLSRGCGLVVTG